MEKDQKIKDKRCSVGTRANRSPCSCPNCGNPLYLTDYYSLYCLNCCYDSYYKNWESEDWGDYEG